MCSPVMTTAQTTTQVGECVDGLKEVTRRLRDQLGVTITHSADVPAEDVGWWISSDNTVTLRSDATPEQMVWLLAQLWLLLVLGPDAAAPAIIEPMLALVPATT